METGIIKLSIIIVSYNTKEITRQCLQSIYNATWKERFEIIVVDNNSTDGSVEMIRTEFPDVVVIENKENKFFAIPNNQGAKIAKGKFLLLLNSDTVVYDNNLQKMIDYFDILSEKVVCIGPKILNKNLTVQSCGHGLWSNTLHRYCAVYGLSKFLPLRYFSPYLDKRPCYTHKVGWVAGCCMMMRTDVYKSIGGLNENLIFYGEEPEFGFRSRKLGYDTIYFSDAEIIHLGGASTEKPNSKKEDFEKDFKEYSSLVKETIGYKKGIKFAKILRTSLKIKKLFYKDKQKVQYAIDHETKNINAFKQLILSEKTK